MKLYFTLIYILLTISCASAVVGGQVLDSTDIPPSIVHLKTQQKDGREYCTGTLIGPKTVLTAAHCLGKSLRLIKKYRPKVEVKFFEDGQEFTQITRQHLAHPDYEKHEKADLALIFLNESVYLPEYPRLSKVSPEDDLHVLGFGLNGKDDQIDGKLRQTMINVKEINTRYFSSFNIKNGPCSGDSGGAVYRAGSNTQEILGVTYYVNPSLNEEQQSYLADVRWDRERLIEAYPYIDKLCFNSTSYFMNTSSYKDWIEQNKKEVP